MKVLRILLQPFSYLYGNVMRLRNYFYDHDYRKSFHFDTRTVSIGNLALGGAGKTPMTEYIIRLLQGTHNVVTLSRGYGRRTKGFRLANKGDSGATIGDEPYQYYKKFPKIHVTVGEERALAIPFILAELPDTDIILLDDAFQHRAVLPDWQILVTEYTLPFYKDKVVPAGRLREFPEGARRADAIVVTKCPENLSFDQMKVMNDNIHKWAPGKDVYFSVIDYLEPVQVSGTRQEPTGVLLITGIANPIPLVEFLKRNYTLKGHMPFPDHHIFTSRDVSAILNTLNNLSGNTVIVTTEKDMSRLRVETFTAKFGDTPLFYIPIKVRFLRDGSIFDKQILKIANSQSS